MKYSRDSSLQHLTYLKLQNIAKEMGEKEETKKFANSIQVEITKNWETQPFWMNPNRRKINKRDHFVIFIILFHWCLDS